MRADPRGVGTFGARDALAREVKLLGALLSQVIVEQEGPPWTGGAGARAIGPRIRT